MSSRLFRKDGPADEARDAHGRWMRDLLDRHQPYGTTGIVGLSRDQVVGKVRGLLDHALSHSEGLPRVGTYAGALATKIGATVLGYATGVPGPEHLAPNLEAHIAAASGYVTHKVLSHPAWRRLATTAVLRVKKNLSSGEDDELKGIVAGVIADTRLHPRVCCNDTALARVAHGAYQHCYSRLCALKDAASQG